MNIDASLYTNVTIKIPATKSAELAKTKKINKYGKFFELNPFLK